MGTRISRNAPDKCVSFWEKLSFLSKETKEKLVYFWLGPEITRNSNGAGPTDLYSRGG